MDIAIPYIHTDTSAFGDDREYVTHLCAALAGLGHKVTIYARRGDPQLAAYGDHHQYTVRELSAGPATPLATKDLIPAVQRFTEELLSCWRHRRPDIVHAQHWPAALATELAARELALPTVVTHHPTPSAGPDEQSHARRITAHHADWLVVLNTAHATQLTRQMRSRTRVAVIPCGVDTERYTPHGPTTPRGDFAHRLVYVSSGHLDDGSETTIEALTAITATELLILDAPQTSTADNSHANTIQGLAQKHGVTERVRWCGAIEEADLPALLRSADIVVHLPRNDPTGSIPLKAMASGVPVIAATIDAPADIIIDEVTGYLITPGDSRQCATTVKRLLAQPFQRQALGAAGRDRARSRYCWDRIATDTIQIYQQALTPTD